MAAKPALLLPTNFTTPGAFGYTEEVVMGDEGSQWLSEARNAVFTDDGLLAPRQLFRLFNQPSDGIPNLLTEAAYPTYAGKRYLVSCNNGLYNQYGSNLFSYSFTLDDGMEEPDLPAYTKHWKAVYLANAGDEDGIYVFAQQEHPKYWDGSLFFSQIGTAPMYGIAHAAFGRIWASNGQTLKWCVLMNGKDWTGSGSGELALNSYLGDNEIVTSIADFNNYLVIFTNKSTLIFQNPFNVTVDIDGAIATSDLMSLKEKIDGTGCVGINAWCSIGEELFFYSYSGLYRMSRVMSDGGSNPIGVVCPQINNALVSAMSVLSNAPVYPGSEAQETTEVRLNYHPEYGFMTVETMYPPLGVFLIWLRRPIGNNSYAVTRWGGYSEDKITGQDGSISVKTTEIAGLYSGGARADPLNSSGRVMLGVIKITNDSMERVFASVASYGVENPNPIYEPVAETLGFEFRVKSQWLDFGANPAGPVEKIPKDLKIIYRMPRSPTNNYTEEWAGFVPTPLTVRFNLKFDFDRLSKRTHSFIAPLDTYFDNNNFVFIYNSQYEVTPVPLSGSGSLVQWELVADINNMAHEAFAIQKTGFQTKLGRINQGI